MRTKIPSYIKIFAVLGDGEWHKSSEFLRPFSQDLRRLREMKEHGWIEYEYRHTRNNDRDVLYTEYRITQIWPTWWYYYRQHSLTKINPETKQMELVI